MCIMYMYIKTSYNNIHDIWLLTSAIISIIPAEYSLPVVVIVIRLPVQTVCINLEIAVHIGLS